MERMPVHVRSAVYALAVIVQESAAPVRSDN